ncbi:MAG: hypothetical protein LBE08_06000 [Bifidobacteriaceae bacterium]|jgi:hypothetical protein|nr:hypothetical protein [Bifidobacteriaceae bacterium]
MAQILQAAIADRRADLASPGPSTDVEARIAAWLSIVGDRNSLLRRILRDAAAPPLIPDQALFDEVEIDDTLLMRLLASLDSDRV